LRHRHSRRHCRARRSGSRARYVQQPRGPAVAWPALHGRIPIFPASAGEPTGHGRGGWSRGSRVLAYQTRSWRRCRCAGPNQNKTMPRVKSTPPAPAEIAPEILPPDEPAPAEVPAEVPAPVIPTAQEEPPCPPKGPAGDKDPDHMAWMAQYRPALFIQQYQTRGGEAVQKLLTKARACLNQ